MRLLNYIENKVDHFLDSLGSTIYVLLTVIHVVYVFVFLGIVFFNISYLNALNVFIQLFICFILIFRFHPYRKHALKAYDARFIFASAVFLLTNLGFIQFMEQFFPAHGELLRTGKMPDKNDDTKKGSIVTTLPK